MRPVFTLRHFGKLQTHLHRNNFARHAQACAQSLPKSVLFLLDRLLEAGHDFVLEAVPPVPSIKIECGFHHKALAVFVRDFLPERARERALAAEDRQDREDESGVIHAPVAHRDHHVGFAGEDRAQNIIEHRVRESTHIGVAKENNFGVCCIDAALHCRAFPAIVLVMNHADRKGCRDLRRRVTRAIVDNDDFLKTIVRRKLTQDSCNVALLVVCGG